MSNNVEIQDAPGVEVPAQSRTAFLTRYVKDSTAEEYRSAVEVRTVDTPAVGAGDVLIRVALSPINPSDQMKLIGAYNPAARAALPFAIGNEGSGTVVRAGGGGYAATLLGRRVGFVAGAAAWGEYVVLPAQKVLPLPEDVSLEAGSSPFVNPMTVASMVQIARDGGHKAVLKSAGASALSKMFVRLAAAEGIKTVSTVRRESQVAELLELGAAAVVVTSGDPAEWRPKLKAALAEHDVHLAFDAVGGAFTGEIVAALPNHSQVQVYGGLSGKAVEGVSITSLIFEQKTVTGFWLVTYLEKGGAENFMKLAGTVTANLNGALSTKVRKTYPLDQVADALADYAANMSGGKVLIGSGQ